MDIRNCPHCGKLFAFDGKNKLCPVCRNSEEDDYQKVKDFLWDHPNASIEEVHIATEVERELIIKFVRDGRLVAEGIDFDFMIECERCGQPIMSGRFCAKCQQDLIDGFSSSNSKKEKNEKKDKKTSDKMYTADRVRKRGSQDKKE